MREGELLWTPSAARAEASNLTAFTRWLERRRGEAFADYEALWRWSVSDTEGFWSAVWDYFIVMSDAPYTRVLTGAGMLEARWFEGARVNYAEHVLRHEASAALGETALRHASELRPWASLSWQELGSSVRRVATRLRELGIAQGDRIGSYLPNVPETVIAMLATTAVGAIWSSAAPEFGAKAVIERFGQIGPKLIFATDGYSFNGRSFDRRREVAEIVGALPTVKHLVWLDYAGLEPTPIKGLQTSRLSDLIGGVDIAAADFRYERVAFDHPLWVLYSSGTTGIPKAITHSHVGMVAEHLKLKSLALNLSPSTRNFFYTTTGWMMWNSVVSSLLTGSSAVLYDGSPTAQGVDTLWRLAAESGATVFGASPTLVQSMKAAGIRPAERYNLSRLDTILLGGAPATPDVFAWFYSDVKPDLWVTSSSGGTELCSSLVGGVPTLPVYAGEIQGRQLGMDVHAWSDDGEELVDEVGELVVTRPFPSQPIFFWGDEGGRRYRDSYFETFPGVWRHGDLLKINRRGGCFVYGRSDATLNRYGVRIGSAEIYRVLAQTPEIADSLIVCCELPAGGYYMPLFIRLATGAELGPELEREIAKRLREEASPRHVPDEVHAAPAIPYTLTGKKMEVPIRKLLMGHPAGTVASRDAMADPASLDWYAAFAIRPEVVARRSGASA